MNLLAFFKVYVTILGDGKA